MKTPCAVAIAAALGLLAALPASAQTLTHRYSFSDATGSTTAADSVGGANGTVNNNVTFSGGVATFGGGTTSSNPSYITLPLSTVSSLQNATLEFYTTSFTDSGPKYQGIFSLANAYSVPGQPNYTVLTANRASQPGVGVGARTNGVPENENVNTGTDLVGGQLVTLVYSGFSGIGSTGTLTIYVNGAQAASGSTEYSYADVASAGATIVGIGGGSPYNDPTYQGSMTEVRLWSGAFTPDQVVADYKAGPDVVAAPEPSQIAGIGIGVLCLGLLAIKARKRAVAS